MNSDHPYMKKIRDCAMKQVIDDLVKERLAGLQGPRLKDSYKEKHEFLEEMGISITRNALKLRVRRGLRKRHPKPTEEAAPGSEMCSPPSPPDDSQRQQEENDDDTELPSLGDRDLCSDDDDEDAPEDELIPDLLPLQRGKAGRPTGTTEERKERIQKTSKIV